VPYVRIQPAAKTILSDDELKGVGLIPVYRREDAVIAAYSPERDLKKFDAQLKSYATESKKLAALAKIETILPWRREDRTSPRLRALGVLEMDREYTVDVLLLPIETASANPQAARVIEQFVTGRQGRIVDRALNRTFSALRVRLGGQGLDELLEYRDDIALVDLPPAAHVLVPQVMSMTVDDLPEIPEPSATAPAVCVVDSGILEGHPLLSSAVLDSRSRSFPEALGPPIPRSPVTDAGHGTQVAGIALYGDVGAATMAKSFEPPLWLLNARFLDDNNALHPDRMPFLREVVQHVRERCRVLNLSFGLEPSDQHLSVHAAELDSLTREFGVLFVIAAGNSFDGKPPTIAWPDFLLDPTWRVLTPGEALNVLTIGGVTPDRDPHPPHPHRKAVAPKRSPSPFSRSGALKNVIKPELVELAGNLAYDDEGTRRWIDNDPGLGVPTTHHRFAEGKLLACVRGTSFAAPKVAHMAARILEHHPDATPNLLRALLVQSAVFPEGVRSWEASRALRLCGFGVPSLDRALHCRPQRVTLYYEGEIKVDEVKLFEIPVPKEIARAKGRKTLSVTVAYDPPVSVVHHDRPAGIQVVWSLARGDVSEAQIERAIAAEAEKDMAATEASSEGARQKRVFMTGELPSRAQQRGTVRKNIFSWKRGEYGDPYRLAITAKATRPAHANDKQRFSIVATLECEDLLVNIYTTVRARLAAGRVRVRVTSDR
jgi:hypothetical protein